MQFTTLGDSGLNVSKIIVGCMTFGLKQWADWCIEEEDQVMEILYKCYQNGLRTFDTADVYSNGVSEKLLAKFIEKYNIPRDRIVILSKLFFPVEPEILDFRDGFQENDFPPFEHINSKGLSRKHIFDAVEKSVERLGTYIDVLQIHRLDKTPKKEIMKALNDIVDKGYTRYLGASSMKAVEFAELQFIAEQNGWFKFISMQNYYNLIHREDERELIPFLQSSTLGKVTSIPWSPIARGFLARPIGGKLQDNRDKSDKTIYRMGLNSLSDADIEIINRVEKISKKLGFSMANIATAWVLAKGHCPIVGINSIERVDDTLRAFDVKLSEDDINYLEEPYAPKNPIV